MLAIVACARNEAPYLGEWLAFQRLVGVAHVYLYDNEGSAMVQQVLERHAGDGWLTVVPWTGVRERFPARRLQHQAHAHCIAHYARAHPWLLKTDIDEFLVPCGGAESVTQALAAFDPQEVRAIRVPRYNFGHNGHLTPPGDLVTASYTRREATWSNHKDIASTRWLSSNRFTASSHWWRFRPTAYLRRYVREHEVSTLRIHHYYTKSLAEYLERQNPAGGRKRSREWFEEHNAARNSVADDTMKRFESRLRASLAAS
jgi:hypothetical protein